MFASLFTTTVSSLGLKISSVIQGLDLHKFLYRYFSQNHHDVVNSTKYNFFFFNLFKKEASLRTKLFTERGDEREI